MTDVTILHNKACSTSRAAMDRIAEAGAVADVVQYLLHPLDAAELAGLLDKLEDPATDLVRRDAYFKELGLTDADVATPEQIIEVLTAHPRLMQRPILVKGDRAIIGRPKERVATFLAD